MAASNDPEKVYRFNRDYRSTVRLNLQHFMIKSLAGYLVHPKVDLPLDGRIADVGAGSCIWLQELAEQFPAAQLVGFDVSGAQFPSPWFLAPNVRVEERDCYAPFPPEHVGRYDFVRIGLFRMIVRNNDAASLLMNVASLLKPGGYLQWVDYLANATHAYTDNPSATTAAHEELVPMIVKPTPENSADWVDVLPQTFEEHGFEVVAADRIDHRNTYRGAWIGITLATLDDFNAGATGEMGVKVKGMMQDVKKEGDMGVNLDLPLTCVVGRKRD